jgi:hypothetical protein
VRSLTVTTAAPASLRWVAQSVASDQPSRLGPALTALTPAVRELYDLDEADFGRAWTAGNPADFLAATLYRDTRYVLRLHVHAPGAADCDLHTHKGIVRSTVINGAMRHEQAAPVFGTAPAVGGLDVWQCGSPHGRHVMARTLLTATVDPSAVRVDELRAGTGFRIDPGQYHRIAAGDDPGEPTVSLCLFEINDTCRAEPYVLTNRPTPTVAARAMTPGYARTALRRVLDRGLDYSLAG